MPNFTDEEIQKTKDYIWSLLVVQDKELLIMEATTDTLQKNGIKNTRIGIWFEAEPLEVKPPYTFS